MRSFAVALAVAIVVGGALLLFGVRWGVAAYLAITSGLMIAGPLHVSARVSAGKN